MTLQGTIIAQPNTAHPHPMPGPNQCIPHMSLFLFLLTDPPIAVGSVSFKGTNSNPVGPVQQPVVRRILAD